MAKYVLLSFDDDKDADRFVDNFELHYVFQAIDVIDNNPHGFEYVGVRAPSYVRAVFQRPTMFHDPKTCSQTRTSGWTRGVKRGWMICTLCGKPAEGWARGDGWYTALGTNQLPVSDRAPEFRGVGVPGHYWDPVKRLWIKWSDQPPEAFKVIRGADGKPEGISVQAEPVLTKEQGEEVIAQREGNAQ